MILALKKSTLQVHVTVQQKRIRLESMRTWAQSLSSFSGLRIWHHHELWCRLQTQGLDPALLWLWCGVVWVSSYSSNLTPSLGTSICCGVALQKAKKKKKSTLVITRSEVTAGEKMVKRYKLPVEK